VAQEAVDIMTPASHARRQSLTITGGPMCSVTADGARVRQVLVNLIGNAVKFTEANGQITIGNRRALHGLHAMGRRPRHGHGPGIAALDRVSIFEPYFRSEGTAAIPGVGLGLAISSALVKQMGGRARGRQRVGGRLFVHTLAAPCWS
jgi:signal transduction histidine kinase